MSTSTNASSNRSARLRSRTSASRNNFSLSTSCSRRQRHFVVVAASIAADDRRVEGNCSWTPRFRRCRRAGRRAHADGSSPSWRAASSVRRPSAARSAPPHCRGAASAPCTRTAAATWPSRKPTDEVNLAHRRAQDLRRARPPTRSGASPPSGALLDGERGPDIETAVNVRACALDSQEMPERGFVVTRDTRVRREICNVPESSRASLSWTGSVVAPCAGRPVAE